MAKVNSGCSGAASESLVRWFSASPGKELLERESACVAELVGDLFGYYLLQVGGSREFIEPVSHSPIRFHLALEPKFPGMGGGSTMIGADNAFPVAGDSIDAVFLPHTLDFTRDPHQVLRETERVLIPEGRVVILGFNPWSLWGLWHLLRRRGGEVPWCGAFLSQRRVADWLALLGFDVERQRPLMFMPPLRQAGVLRRLQVLDSAGLRWLPLFSGVYAIRAVKRVSTLTPLQPRWKRRSALPRGRAVEPTARGGAGV